MGSFTERNLSALAGARSFERGRGYLDGDTDEVTGCDEIEDLAA